MALSERIALFIDADPRSAIKGFEATAASAEKNLSKTQMQTQKMGMEFTRYGAMMMATAGAIGVGLYGMAKQHADANQSQMMLQNTLANMPKLAGETTDSFNELADSIQGKTAADGDQIVAGMALLGTFQVTADQIKGMMPLIVDYAQKFGTDIPTASKQVGKALDGQIGALKKNGVSIDENLYKTDKYAAVQQALRQQVGGFAEQEGRTFEGSLQRIKNELGDVAEGIGGGVASAMMTLSKPITLLSDGLGKLSPQSQGMIGTMLTLGTVALFSAGAISFVAGKVQLMGDRFIVAAGQAGVMGTSFTAAGFAATAMTGALGLIGIAIMAYTMLKREGTKATEEFTNAIIADDGAMGTAAASTGKVKEMFGQIAGEAARAGVTYEQFTGALGEFNSEAKDASNIMVTLNALQQNHSADEYLKQRDAIVEQLRNEGGARNELIASLIMQGEHTDGLGQKLDSLFDEADKNKQVAEDLVVTGAAVTGTFEGEQAAAQGLTGDLEAQATAQQKLLDLKNSYLDSNLALQNANLSFQDSIWKVEDAQVKLDETITAHGPTSREAEQATNDLVKAQLDQQTSALRVADAQVKLALDQAEANGKTLSASDAALIQIQTLQKLADQTNGPTRDALLGMIAELERTSGDWPINVVLTPNAEAVMRRMENLRETGQYIPIGGAYASGGYVPPGQLSLVGENGPELFVSQAGGQIIPNHRLSSAMGTGGGGIGGGTNINIVVNAGLGTDGRSVADAVVAELQKWYRRNGPVPVRTN